MVLRGQGPNVLASAAGLTVAQVAWHLQVSTALIYQLIDRGELGHVRVSNAIRIPADQLQAYLARPR